MYLTLEAPQAGDVFSVAFTSDEKYVAAGQDDGWVTIWEIDYNAENFVSVQFFLAEYNARVLHLAFRPNPREHELISVHSNGAVQVHNVSGYFHKNVTEIMNDYHQAKDSLHAIVIELEKLAKSHK